MLSTISLLNVKTKVSVSGCAFSRAYENLTKLLLICVKLFYKKQICKTILEKLGTFHRFLSFSS